MSNQNEERANFIRRIEGTYQLDKVIQASYFVQPGPDGRGLKMLPLIARQANGDGVNGEGVNSNRFSHNAAFVLLH